MECYCIRYRCVRSDDWCIVTASAITVCRVMPDALLLHSSMYSEQWLMHDYCISHYLCLVMTATVLLHQSAMCADGETMHCYSTRQQCVGWGPVHCCSISYLCVPFDVWRTITASVINVCGDMTGALLLNQSSLCAGLTGKLLMYQSSLSGGNDWRNIPASVFILCGAMTRAILTNQPSMCAEWWLAHY